MKLFEIADQIEEILTFGVDVETGEISEEAIDALAELDVALEEKALNVARYIIGERAESAAIKAQADVLSKRASTHKKRAERLAKYLKDHIGDESYSDATVTIRWINSTAVVIDDAERIPDSYKTTPEPVPSKKLIGDAIKAGLKVIGARLEKRRNIQIK